MPGIKPVHESAGQAPASEQVTIVFQGQSRFVTPHNITLNPMHVQLECVCVSPSACERLGPGVLEHVKGGVFLPKRLG